MPAAVGDGPPPISRKLVVHEPESANAPEALQPTSFRSPFRMRTIVSVELGVAPTGAASTAAKASSAAARRNAFSFSMCFLLVSSQGAQARSPGLAPHEEEGLSSRRGRAARPQGEARDLARRLADLNGSH